MTTDLLETIKDGVAVLTMNRPDRLNAMSVPMLDAMLEALQRLAEDSAVGTVVLTDGLASTFTGATGSRITSGSAISSCSTAATAGKAASAIAAWPSAEG